MVARDLLLAQLETRDTLSPCDLQLLLCHIGKCHLPKVPVGLFESPWCRSAPWCVAAGRTDGLHWGLLQIPPPPPHGLGWSGKGWGHLQTHCWGCICPPPPPQFLPSPPPPALLTPPSQGCPPPRCPYTPAQVACGTRGEGCWVQGARWGVLGAGSRVWGGFGWVWVPRAGCGSASCQLPLVAEARPRPSRSASPGDGPNRGSGNGQGRGGGGRTLSLGAAAGVGDGHLPPPTAAAGQGFPPPPARGCTHLGSPPPPRV